MNKLYPAVVLATLLTACGGSDGNSPEKQTKPEDNSEAGDTPPKTVFSKTFNDESGEVNFAFVDLTGAEIKATENTITVSMTLLSLDGPFTINSANVSNNYTEYSWLAQFDVIPKTDLGLTHFKFSDTSERQVQELDSFVQKDLWVDGSSIVTPTVVYAGNKITITIPKSAHSVLEKITSNTKITFSTYYVTDTVSDVKYSDRIGSL